MKRISQFDTFAESTSSLEGSKESETFLDALGAVETPQSSSPTLTCLSSNPTFETSSIQPSAGNEEVALKSSMRKLLSKHLIIGLLCLMVAFGGFVFGWDTGTISGFVQMPSFKQTFGEWNVKDNSFEFTNTRVGLIISIFNIGCAVGGITLGKLGDVFGRKIGLMGVMMIYIVGIIVQISSFHWVQFMVGRIISGLAVGAVSVLSPMFIAETSPAEIRGIMVSCYQLMITLGILLGYITTFGTVHSYDDARQWRIPLGLCFVWAVAMIGGMLFLPESARYLIEKGHMEKARLSVAKVNSMDPYDEVVQQEIETFTLAIAEQHEAGNASWMELLMGKPRILARLIIGIALHSFQQLTGNNYFFYYGTSIFKSVGLQDSFVTSIILGAVNFGSTFIALYSIGKVGRRPNLLYGSVCMAACLLTFSVIGSTILYPNGFDQPTDKQAGGAMIFLTCMFIFTFATTWAPGVFVVVSETYPLRIRSKGMAIATAANWLWGFMIAFFTPFIISHIRFAYGFVFFGCTVAAAIFVYLMVPETGGLSLEQVDVLYKYYKPGQAQNTRDEAEESVRVERLNALPPFPYPFEEKISMMTPNYDA